MIKRNLMLVFIFVFAFTMIASMVSAETYKQNAQSNLTMDCLINGVPQPSATATLSVQKIGDGLLVDNQAMTSVGNGKFIYQTTLTQLGDYELTGTCTSGSLNWTTTSQVEVTSTGNDKSLYIPLIVGLFAVILLIIGLVRKNFIFGLFAAFLFIVLGIYTMIYGLGNINDSYTQMISYIIIGIGAIIGFSAVGEMYLGWDGFGGSNED